MLQSIFRVFWFTILTLLLKEQHAFAQSYTISGFVEDAANGERLIGANIYDPISLTGTTSNSYGFFSLKLPRNVTTVRFSYVGFASLEMEFPANNDTSLIVKLTSAAELEEVIVSGTEIRPVQDRTEMSRISVPVNQIKSIPAILGEQDVLKAIQLLPGVASGNEGSSGFYVRGGGPDQNLILLDGVPVYNASHLFGFFSVFNSDAIKNVTLHKGGFPARFGGRLSSVLEIDMKEGNQQKFEGNASISPIASRIMLEGPIWKDRTSFVISARRSFLDLLLRPFIEAENSANAQSRGGYFFHDVTAKVNHVVNEKNRLYASVYTGLDRFYVYDFYRNNEQRNVFSDEFDFKLQWGNTTSALRWNHLFSNRLFSNTTLTYSRFFFGIDLKSESYSKVYPNMLENDFEENREFYRIDNSSGVRDWAGRTDFEFIPSPQHKMRFGASITLHRYFPESTQFVQRGMSDTTNVKLESSPPLNANEATMYFEEEWSPNNDFSVNAGMHFSTYESGGQRYFSAEPRLATRYAINENSSVKLAYSFMRQYVHLLTNVSINLPTDLWLPSNDKIRPQNAHQIGLGFARGLSNNTYELSIEAYHKWFNNLVEYKEGAQFLAGSEDLFDQLETGGRGTAYGVELFLQKQLGKTTGWIGYTLSWTWREFENLNAGERFPYKYDRRHDVSVVVSHKFSKTFELSGTWVFASGSNLTLAQKRYVAPPPNGLPVESYDPFVISYGRRNSFRMDPYHRMDIGLRKSKEKKRGVRTWSIGAYNAYSRLNPYFVYVDPQQTVTEVTQVSFLPIIPYLAWEFKF